MGERCEEWGQKVIERKKEVEKNQEEFNKVMRERFK